MWEGEGVLQKWEYCRKLPKKKGGEAFRAWLAFSHRCLLLMVTRLPMLMLMLVLLSCRLVPRR